MRVNILMGLDEIRVSEASIIRLAHREEILAHELVVRLT